MEAGEPPRVGQSWARVRARRVPGRGGRGRECLLARPTGISCCQHWSTSTGPFACLSLRGLPEGTAWRREARGGGVAPASARSALLGMAGTWGGPRDVPNSRTASQRSRRSPGWSSWEGVTLRGDLEPAVHPHAGLSCWLLVAGWALGRQVDEAWPLSSGVSASALSAVARAAPALSPPRTPPSPHAQSLLVGLPGSHICPCHVTPVPDLARDLHWPCPHTCEGHRV